MSNNSQNRQQDQADGRWPFARIGGWLERLFPARKGAWSRRFSEARSWPWWAGLSLCVVLGGGWAWAGSPESGQYEALGLEGTTSFSVFTPAGQQFLEERTDFTTVLWDGGWMIEVRWDSGAWVRSRRIAHGSLSWAGGPKWGTNTAYQVAGPFPATGASWYTRLLWMAFCRQVEPSPSEWESLPFPLYDALYSPEASLLVGAPVFEGADRSLPTQIVYRPATRLDRKAMDERLMSRLSWDEIEATFRELTNQWDHAALTFSALGRMAGFVFPREITAGEWYRSTNGMPRMRSRALCRVTRTWTTNINAATFAVPVAQPLMVTDVRLRLPTSNLNWLNYKVQGWNQVPATNSPEFQRILGERLPELAASYAGRPGSAESSGPGKRGFVIAGLVAALFVVGLALWIRALRRRAR